jgi:hypothetical protein
MPDSELQITLKLDASGVSQGAGQAKSALAGLGPEIAALGKSFDDLGKSLKGSLDGFAKIGAASASAATASRKAAEETRRAWDGVVDPLVHTFTSGLVKMAEGTRTFGQVLKSLGQELLNDFITKVIDPMLERWLWKELGQTAATAAGVAQRSAANTAGASEDAAVTGTAALKDLMSSAAAAAGQAYKALAGIPIVGPALGAAAAGAAFAGVMAFQGMIQSAERGYDIPGGVNPITQLHTREMVLPAHLADRVRAMTANDNRLGDSHTTFNYTAHAYGSDADDIERVLARHGGRVQRYVQNAARNNALRGMRRA